MADTPKKTASPWHAGERALHENYGVADKMEMFGARAIRDFMPDQHREFFSKLPFIVTGSVDEAGDVWTSMIFGRPGFLDAPTTTRLDVSAGLASNDPASPGFKRGAAVGLLGIDQLTRRRNRMNGTIRAINEGGFSVDVSQSFGNCPKYIQPRAYHYIRDPDQRSSPVIEEGASLSVRARKIIDNADTFFVASYVDLEPERQVDVSHRGGEPGFVRIGDDDHLTIPDYAGNFYFNTLGNFIENPRAGLLFPDFESGDLLNLTGDAKLILDSPLIETFDGAERIWEFHPRRIVLQHGTSPLRWSSN